MFHDIYKKISNIYSMNIFEFNIGESWLITINCFWWIIPIGVGPTKRWMINALPLIVRNTSIGFLNPSDAIIAKMNIWFILFRWITFYLSNLKRYEKYYRDALPPGIASISIGDPPTSIWIPMKRWSVPMTMNPGWACW